MRLHAKTWQRQKIPQSKRMHTPTRGVITRLRLHIIHKSPQLKAHARTETQNVSIQRTQKYVGYTDIHKGRESA